MSWQTAELQTELQAAVDKAKASGSQWGIVVDALDDSGKVAISADEVFPQASAIKIPILMELMRQAEQGDIDLATRVVVEASDQVDGTGALYQLGDGTTSMSVADLATLMIVLSDNTATNLIIDRVGAERVNAMLQELGQRITRLHRQMRDTEAVSRGVENLSTPAEAAQLMRTLFLGEFVNRSVSDGILRVLRLPKQDGARSILPSGGPHICKPGALSGVKTLWAIVETARHPYVIVLMGRGGTDAESDRWMREYSDLIASYLGAGIPEMGSVFKES